MEDKKHIQLAQEGDQEAFGFLVNKYKTKVFNLALSITYDRDDADDLAQEIFVKIYSAIHQFKFRSEFSTWLYQVSINHIRDFLRKKRRMRLVSFNELKEKQIPQEEETLVREKEQSHEQRRQLVLQVIETLPEKPRIILSLRDIHGMSYGDISNILKISPGTVDSRLHRARKMLRKKILPYLFRKGGNNEL